MMPFGFQNFPEGTWLRVSIRYLPSSFDSFSVNSTVRFLKNEPQILKLSDLEYLGAFMLWSRNMEIGSYGWFMFFLLYELAFVIYCFNQSFSRNKPLGLILKPFSPKENLHLAVSSTLVVMDL